MDPPPAPDVPDAPASPFAPTVAVPAMADPATARRARYANLATTALALAILEIVQGLFRVITQIANMAYGTHHAFTPKTVRGEALTEMTELGTRFAQRIGPWEIARAVPFLVASALLVSIALRIKRGDVEALRVARQWAFLAFGVLALSVLIQAMVTVPATLDYQEHLVAVMPVVMPKSGAPPFDVKALIGSMTKVGALLGLVFGTAAMAAWPIILYVWAGKLLRAPAAS
jgi:hypothetical protein